MTKHGTTGEPSTSFAPSHPVPILDLATDLPVGYFTGEYLHTRARSGLIFFHANKLWRILYIASDETVSVLRLKDRSAILSGSMPIHDPQIARASRLKLTSNSRHHLPSPPNRLINLESFQNYLVIHTSLGDRINFTLRLAFDVMLTEQDLTRDSYNDASRILIQTPVKLTREELNSISEDLSRVGPRELERFVHMAIDSIFPFVMDKRTQSLKTSQTKNVLAKKLRSILDIKQAKAICGKISEGKIKILTHFSMIRATSAAEEMIEQREKMNALELEELIKENVAQFKNAIQHKTAELLCLDCLSPQAPEGISGLEDKPKCRRCGSGLLALVGATDKTISNLASMKKSGKHLSRPEIERLAKVRRTADLILSYGKSAVIALNVTGIGPQTASTILASMQTDTAEFYYDLLKAKIHFITTRELWEKTRT